MKWKEIKKKKKKRLDIGMDCERVANTFINHGPSTDRTENL